MRVFLCLVLLALPARAEPVLSLAGTMPANGDYGLVLKAIEEVGASATSLTLFWDDFDRGEGYEPADADWPAIANAVYPDRGLSLHLTLAVIDTVADRRPEDLLDRPWDDAEVVDRFTGFVTEVLGRLPDTDLLALSIGNEVDGHLTPVKRESYARFFQQARAIVKRLRPDLPVTVTQTWPALRDDPAARRLADLGDGWSVTYYPLDPGFAALPPEQTRADMSQLRALTGGPVWLAEAGYPSDACGAASPAAQAQFFDVLLAATEDAHLVQLVWSHDISPAQVAAYRGYYAIANPCFASYLSSLGLKTADDAPKPAFEALTGRAR